MAEIILPALLLIILVLGLVIFILLRKLKHLNVILEETLFQKKSQSVKYGKLTEQFIPFTTDFPFDSSSFRFIGTPIDGIAFDNEKIYFCEFKTASSTLSSNQKRIKKLVEEKKIKWFEFKVN